MKFGLIKSKIETVLAESYKNNNFKNEMKLFKLLVLENKNVGKLFQLYNELTTNKGLDESSANDYINECIKIYENTVNKIKNTDLKLLNHWLKDIKTKNQYETIDKLFSNDITLLEEKISSRKLIRESLKKKSVKIQKEIVKLPLSTMINVANKTISNYIDNLNESQKKELKNYLTIPENELKTNFDSVKTDVIGKLTSLKESVDKETKDRISETIEKVNSEECNVFSFVKLKNLRDNL